MRQNGLYCLDELPDDLKIGGGITSDWRSELTVAVVPCNAKFFWDDEISPDCITDITAQKNYLGSSIQIAFLSNFDRVDP